MLSVATNLNLCRIKYSETEFLCIEAINMRISYIHLFRLWNRDRNRYKVIALPSNMILLAKIYKFNRYNSKTYNITKVFISDEIVVRIPKYRLFPTHLAILRLVRVIFKSIQKKFIWELTKIHLCIRYFH